jgi:hypothetical protein
MIDKKKIRESPCPRVLPNLINPPNVLVTSESLLKSRICKRLNRKTKKHLLNFFNEADMVILSDLWVIIIEYLFHEFDYDVIVVRYGRYISGAPTPVVKVAVDYFGGEPRTFAPCMVCLPLLFFR